MLIAIDSQSVLMPITAVKQSTITLKPGTRITIRKVALGKWQVINLVGDYELYEPA